MNKAAFRGCLPVNHLQPFPRQMEREELVEVCFYSSLSFANGIETICAPVLKVESSLHDSYGENRWQKSHAYMNSLFSSDKFREGWRFADSPGTSFWPIKILHY